MFQTIQDLDLSRFCGGIVSLHLENAFPTSGFHGEFCGGIDTIFITANDRFIVTTHWRGFIRRITEKHVLMDHDGRTYDEKDALVHAGLLYMEPASNLVVELTERGALLHGTVDKQDFALRLVDPNRLYPDCFEEDMMWVITPKVISDLPALLT
jgi:hypothetical protein